YVIIGGSYVGSLSRHVFETLAITAGIALHVRVLSGRDPHHIVEAQFKAVARALRAAVARDERVSGVPSAKGRLARSGSAGPPGRGPASPRERPVAVRAGGARTAPRERRPRSRRGMGATR